MIESLSSPGKDGMKINLTEEEDVGSIEAQCVEVSEDVDQYTGSSVDLIRTEEGKDLNENKTKEEGKFRSIIILFKI